MTMSEWQPIETAPKDGTLILAYADSYYGIPFICYWADDNWRFHGKYPWVMRPDVWMAIPEPPKEMNEHE
jgi:hypothetical protein